MPWSLVGQENGDILSISRFPCRVGRHPNAHVRIIHSTVSLCHAEFNRLGDGLVLTDVNSRNGTFVNGNRIDRDWPVAPGDLLQFGATAFRIECGSTQALGGTCLGQDMGDLALALVQFEKMVQQSAVVTHYQPIVTSDTHQTVAYEALGRSRLIGLDKPALMFRAAEYFRMEAALSRMLRSAAVAKPLPDSRLELFLNTHPTELTHIKDLVISLKQLRQEQPEKAITLEVHEAAAVDLSTMQLLRLVLDDLDMKLAYDDFGAGQNRLNELVEARPEYVKFDRQLISGLDRSNADRQRIVESLVSMCRNLKITTLAEGVETAAEAEACRHAGFSLMQGFYFGRPAENFTSPSSLLPTSVSTLFDSGVPGIDSAFNPSSSRS